jgi:uncharacterized membrane protein HdeD (DUF308 family)
MNAITSTQVSRHYWWIMAIRGILAVLFGLAAIVWPGLTLLVLVLLFGAYAIIDGVMAVFISLQERIVSPRWWVLLLEGIAGIIAGVLTFLWPAITALVLLYLIAFWAIVTGLLEIADVFSRRLHVAPDHLAWCGAFESGVVNRDLCPGFRNTPHHPCLPVQNSRYSL